jgi:hypothetical protein
MPKKVSSKNTKAEILEAYQELEKSHQELESQKAAMAKSSTTQSSTVASDKNVKTDQNDKMTKPVESSLSPKKETKETESVKFAHVPPLQASGDAQAQMQTVIDAFKQLGENFNVALSQLSTNLLVEASHLKEIRTTVSDESNHLATLYNLKIKEETLSELLKQHENTAQEYQETLQQQREAAEKAWLEQTQAWQTETEETEQRLREQQGLDKKNQQREDSEYHYNQNLKRHLSDEEYEQQKLLQQQTLTELEEKRQREWQEREKALAEREKQFKEFKEKVERFPKDLEAAIKKAKEEGAGIARSQAKVKTDLVAKEIAGEEEVYQLKIHALEEEVAIQTAQIDRLAQQVESALKQAQELAVKAIEGSSSYTSFQALKEIALEQAKNQPKAK